jgi:hypothetical protein
MDPYLEQRWRDVHASLIAYTRDALQPQLPDDLVARIEENVHLDVEGAAVGQRNPDVYVVESPVPWESRSVAETSASIQPVLLEPDTDPLVERHIEIIEAGGGRVITAIEILSPWNKLDGSGTERYLHKREQYLASRTNLVEVDLVRAGKWWTMVSFYRVPEEHRTIYRVTVKRAAVGKLELYPITLRDRLPHIAVPLRKGEADVTLDLQALVEQVYRNGRYDRTDYSKPCEPPLDADERLWADELLKAAARR